MKAITICQPYAYLITLPAGHPHAKRVENRTWETRHRGLILIHAGKSREWEKTWPHMDEIDPRDLHYGAIVAAATLIACPHVSQVRAFDPAKPLGWVRDHLHTEGPFCWVLYEVRPLAVPIPCPGAQGLWTVTQTAVLQRLAAEGITH